MVEAGNQKFHWRLTETDIRYSALLAGELTSNVRITSVSDYAVCRKDRLSSLPFGLRGSG